MTGSYTQDWLLKPDDYNWRVEPDGGTNLRAVADIGTHWMDLAQFVVGRPIRSVLADLATFHPERLGRPGPPRPSAAPAAGAGRREPVAVTTDDHAAVLLRWDDGARGAFHVSQVTAGRKNRIALEVAGTEGVARLGQRRRPTASGSAIATRPTSSSNATPPCSRPPAARDQPLSRRPRRGLPRHVQAALPDVYDAIAAGRRRDPRLSRPSPTATARSGSARRSRAAPRTGAGSRSLADDRRPSASHRAIDADAGLPVRSSSSPILTRPSTGGPQR